MTNLSLDALARNLGRRRALQAFTAAAATTLTGVTLAGAKSNNGKKQNNRKKRKQQQRRIDKQSLALCAGEVAQCETLIRDLCQSNDDCLAAQLPCCQELAVCDFGGLISCLNALSQA